MPSQPPRQMFRKQALEQLSSPDQLDQLLRVVTRKSWIPISTLAGGLALAIVWSIVARIPISVEGAGLLVYPEQVRSFQAPASGQIVSLDIKVGDEVAKGQTLGRINQSELRQRLEHERIRLVEVKARDLELLQLLEHRLSLEKRSIDRNRQRVKGRIESTSRMAEARQAKNNEYFAKQTDNLARLNEVTQKLGKSVKARYERVLRLFNEKNATEQEAFDAQRESITHDVQLADLGLRIHEIELTRIEAESAFVHQADLVADLQSELAELDVLASKADLLQLETVSESRLRIQEIERSIARYEEQLNTKGAIISEYTGRILEVTAAVGQFVSVGQRLGSTSVEHADAELVVVVYYDVSDGKRIEPGMEALISPTTVQRARFGSMVGSVRTVSSYPVTTDAVTNVVGNAEVAGRLTAGGDKIEVTCEIRLDPASHSGFRWTSGRGPDKGVAEVTAGTTVAVHTTTEHRRPISYVIPVLRRWSGS